MIHYYWAILSKGSGKLLQGYAARGTLGCVPASFCRRVCVCVRARSLFKENRRGQRVRGEEREMRHSTGLPMLEERSFSLALLEVLILPSSPAMSPLSN